MCRSTFPVSVYNMCSTWHEQQHQQMCSAFRGDPHGVRSDDKPIWRRRSKSMKYVLTNVCIYINNLLLKLCENFTPSNLLSWLGCAHLFLLQWFTFISGHRATYHLHQRLLQRCWNLWKRKFIIIRTTFCVNNWLKGNLLEHHNMPTHKSHWQRRRWGWAHSLEKLILSDDLLIFAHLSFDSIMRYYREHWEKKVLLSPYS